MGKGLHSIICLLLALAISAKGQGAAPASTAPTPAATQPATTQPAEPTPAAIDSLLQAFDSQSAHQQRGTSGAILDILTREGFIDEPVCIPAQAKPDSVRALTWYWAGEWYYDLQDYQRAMHYGQKAMKLCSKPTAPTCCPSSASGRRTIRRRCNMPGVPSKSGASTTISAVSPMPSTRSQAYALLPGRAPRGSNISSKPYASASSRATL